MSSGGGDSCNNKNGDSTVPPEGASTESNRAEDNSNATSNGQPSGSTMQQQAPHPSNNLGGAPGEQQYNSCNPNNMSHPSSRNGSPMVRRPPSSCSTNSYHTASTAAANNISNAGQYHVAAAAGRYNNNGSPPAASGGGFAAHHGHHHPQAGVGPPPPSTGQYHHPQGPGGGLIRPTGRYPMPPRSSRGGGGGGASGMHMVRSVPNRPAGGMGNSYNNNPHHHHGQQQHYQHHQNYGTMPPQYEYHPSNYQQQQQHQGHPGSVPPPPPPPPPQGVSAPSPAETENEKQSSSNENQNSNSNDSMQDSVQHQPASTAEEGRPSSANFDHFNNAVKATASGGFTEQTGAHWDGHESGMRQGYDDAQQQQQHHHYSHQQHQVYGGGQAMHHYNHHQGYAREQHYHHSYHSHQPYNHQQHHHGTGYGQYGGPQPARYGNYHQGMGGVSPPPHQATVQCHPSDYQIGPSAASVHHGQYAMHPQEQQHYHNHHAYGPPPQGAFQLPNYTARSGSYNPSPETTMDAPTLSRSPSPPPKPPVSSPHKKPVLLDKTGKPIPSSDCSESSKTALGERGQNTADGDDATPVGKNTGKKEDATADAASILLQLGAPVVKAGDAENENPQNVTDGSVTKHSIPQSVQGSTSMDEASEMTHPDLTSEPSQDSVEHTMQNRVFDSEFPCPIPPKYPTRLCLPYDGAKLNSLHCFLRSDLLEIFVVQKSPHKSPTHSPHSSIGRVGLRCVHCAMNRRFREDRDEAPMAVFYPKSVAEIYRLVTSWQRCHLRKCRNLPPAIRSKWLELRESDKSRGKTHYWVTSAKEIGLRDCHGRAGGIRFAADLDGTQLPPQTQPATYIPEPSNEEDAPRRPPRPPSRLPTPAAVPPAQNHAQMKVEQQDNEQPYAMASLPMHVGEKKSSPRSRIRLPMQNPSPTFSLAGANDHKISDPPGSKVGGGTPQSSNSAGDTILA